ncbi:hypothetical protein [Mesorhizobium sp. CO1-1-8]|uniref:hypothetical protein n=1 Tax=Mesorhizobium sp. CO1-1-8 TaxID=2876631 RepID=UPI001CD113D9|nr:hypothetical protein [Mesorhizobium sp. CO1-1-8]MBZ9772209.1 hypothetical protein [Mesorhizobium sp. CO1-1-8]
MKARCRAFIAGPGAGAVESTISLKVDARYSTQVWEIEVPVRNGELTSAADVAAFVADFHRAHEELFAFSDPASPVVIIGWSAEVSCRFNKTAGLRLAIERTATERPSRQAYFVRTGWTEVPVRQFAALATGETLMGPAIVENSFTTVVVDPGAVATRRASGSLVIEIGSA